MRKYSFGRGLSNTNIVPSVFCHLALFSKFTSLYFHLTTHQPIPPSTFVRSSPFQLPSKNQFTNPNPKTKNSQSKSKPTNLNPKWIQTNSSTHSPHTSLSTTPPPPPPPPPLTLSPQTLTLDPPSSNGSPLSPSTNANPTSPSSTRNSPKFSSKWKPSSDPTVTVRS